MNKVGARRRYYRWRLRKAIREAQKKYRNFRILCLPESPKWKTDLAYWYNAFLYVTEDGIAVQFAGYGSISPPYKCDGLDEAVNRVVSWMIEHPSRWTIEFEPL